MPPGIMLIIYIYTFFFYRVARAPAAAGDVAVDLLFNIYSAPLYIIIKLFYAVVKFFIVLC